MEKILGLILIVVYGVWFFTAQAGNISTDEIQEQEIRLMSDTTVKIALTQSQMHKRIKSVAEQEGWITTEFKSNTLIAEKTTEGNSISVTIIFSKSGFSISPKNIDLSNAINGALGI